MYRGNPEYEAYLHSVAWKRRADERLEIDGHVCGVCGTEATEVHHITYEHFREEPMDDLISLCRRCHEKAEFFSHCPPVAVRGHNFMAAMREDTKAVAPVVLEYLQEVRGKDFTALMALRQPDDPEGRKYWNVLKRAVRALCAKRYTFNCVEDRKDIMVESISAHVCVICLAQIEHDIRNMVQSELHGAVLKEYAVIGKWKTVARKLGISTGILKKLRDDDGSSAGPLPRETVLFYCGLDAAAGIRPLEGFSCLNESDYKELNRLADYMKEETA